MKKLNSKLFSKSIESAELNKVNGGSATSQECRSTSGNSPETCDILVQTTTDEAVNIELPYTLPC